MTGDGASLPPANGGAKSVRFGVIGCGNMGATADDRASLWAVAPYWLPLSHASAILATKSAQLAAVCDINETAVLEAARRYHVPAHYLDYRLMLRSERLDAVTIATRTPERKEIIEACVRHGVRAIYCEKPLSNTLEDADHLSQCLQEHGVFFVYGTRRRYMPLYQQVRKMVQAGQIGTLTSIVVRFGYGGVLWNHPHSVDIASFFADDAAVDYVQADLDLDPRDVRGRVVDADPMVRMGYIRFTNGVSAHIVASQSNDVELAGTEGIVTIRSDGVSAHWRSRLSGGSDLGWFLSDRIEPAPESSSGTVNSIEAVSWAVLEGTYPDYDINLAVRNQEVLFALVESHLKGGGKVQFPLPRRGLRITGRAGAVFA